MEDNTQILCGWIQEKRVFVFSTVLTNLEKRRLFNG